MEQDTAERKDITDMRVARYCRSVEELLKNINEKSASGKRDEFPDEGHFYLDENEEFL